MPAKSKKLLQTGETVLYVEGMHCASCEVLIENKLLKQKGVKAVEASTQDGKVRIEYQNQKPSVTELNQMFKKEKYTFSGKPFTDNNDGPLFKINHTGLLIIDKQKFNRFLAISSISLVIILAFILVNRLGLSSLISVNSKSTLPFFFLFGIMAGLSSCAALVGGIILSMSKQWAGIYGQRKTLLQKIEPHLLFNSGRVVSFALLGGLLGTIGKGLQLSLTLGSVVTILVSVLMIGLALQMLGVKAFRHFQIILPKFATRYVANEDNFKGRLMPAIMGALTFFLPCGFTITAQSLALTSGSAFQGSLIMLLFALGTLPMLLTIGISSTQFVQKPHLSNKFLQIAGTLVLFFALFNINSQLNVLGFKSFNDLVAGLGFGKVKVAEAQATGSVPLIDGKQVIKMNAAPYGYDPNEFKVKVGLPVRWEITDQGTSGCTNAVISKGLFEGQIKLTPGKTSVKEFTPTKVGRYKFSCWMGMVSGVIEVVDSNLTPTQKTGAAETPQEIPSGAKGCGCGGGSGSCGAR